MDFWTIVIICGLALAAIIGNLSLLRRSNTPLRKTPLNELKETLPRNNKLSKDKDSKTPEK
ncbi:hypothetical protein [Thalassotalea aquiviva]|uniref:hypothetical protein n=1 Tax=Thalassotalea aquiviva TaxID=3242415 RepID=UPI00352A065E